jgi:hypothetical protein
VTPAQIIFDVICGIVVPALCLILDPGIVRDAGEQLFPSPPLGQYSLSIYGLSALAIPSLAMWLLLRRRVRAWGGLISGVLLAGAICSLLIGGILFPLSVLALVIGIGILGFTPLVTGFVYLRNAIRSFGQASLHMSRIRLVGSMLLTAILVVAVPAIANWRISRMVSRSVEEIVRNDSASIEDTAQRIKYFKAYVDRRRIEETYKDETDPILRERLAKAYKTITGDDMEARINTFRD